MHYLDCEIYFLISYNALWNARMVDQAFCESIDGGVRKILLAGKTNPYPKDFFLVRANSFASIMEQGQCN